MTFLDDLFGTDETWQKISSRISSPGIVAEGIDSGRMSGDARMWQNQIRRNG